jgi:NADH-quinone oxidoreductase subunit L
VPGWVKNAPLVMMIAGFVVAYIFYVRHPHLPGQLAANQPIL